MASLNNQCAWTATITYNDKSITVSYPLTCEFNIQKSTGSASFCTLNIYNLGKDTRLSEFFRLDSKFEAGRFMMLDFSAGYNNNLVTIFRGQIRSATSTRRGTDIITTIQAEDCGHSLINSTAMSITFKAGTTFIEAFENIASNLKYIQPQTRGTLEGEFKTDTTFYGTPLQILNQITNNHTFVDNSSLIMLNNNEHLPESPIEISAKTGLLSVPTVGEFWVNAQTVFNPTLKIGQAAQLKTTSLEYYNNGYKIYSINHQGTISAAISGQRITNLIMQRVNFTPNSNVNITKQTEKQGEKVVIQTEVKTPGKEWTSGVYDYIRKYHGAIPLEKINNLVSWQNMIGNDNTNDERYAQITPQIIENCIIIANRLQNFINSSYLKGQKIIVTSGWRSIQNNKNSGGEEKSAHLRGAAIDFKFASINTFDAYNSLFKNNWPTFTYYNRKWNIIHVQSTLGKGGAKR